MLTNAAPAWWRFNQDRARGVVAESHAFFIMNIETHIHLLRSDLDRHMSNLSGVRSRLRGVDLLSAPTAQAAVDLRQIASSILNDATHLAQAQRLAAAEARTELMV